MEPNPDAAPLRRRHPLLLGCAGLLVVVIVAAAAVVFTLWWSQRPIRPVVLSPQEKAVVEKKIQEIGGGTVPLEPAPAGESAGPAIPAASDAAPAPVVDSDRPYVPGSKTLKLTEREVNGLLNQNTELGDKVRLEFARDAINAYLAIPIPQDFPIGAGSTIRMRGRFRVSIGGSGQPFAVLDDVTIFGLSLPKAWLGGIKGENLLGDALGGQPVVQGIKSLKIEPGVLVLEVED